MQEKLYWKCVYRILWTSLQNKARGSLELLVNWVARSEARRACEVSMALDVNSTPIAIALGVPPDPVV